MLLKSLFRANYKLNSILNAAKKYKNSKIQQKVHQFEQNQSKLAEQKKRINYYGTIGRESQAKIMIRQFLFQEKQPTYKVNYSRKHLVPSGKWTLEQIQKQFQVKPYLKEKREKRLTDSEYQNIAILNQMQESLKEKLTKYYEKIGKPRYTFSVKEEVEKIEAMTKQQFEDFIRKLNE